MRSDMTLSEFVCVVKGVLDKDVCNGIISEYKKDQDHAKYSVVQKDDGTVEVDKKSRHVKELTLSSPSFWKYNSDRVNLVQSIEDSAIQIVGAYSQYLMNKDIVAFTPKIVSDEGFKLLHYKKEYKFVQHVDELPNSGRVLTCSIALNDGFKGGDFTFFDNAFKCEVEAGDAIVFPSNFMFPHAVTPIEKGERFSIITWFH